MSIAIFGIIAMSMAQHRIHDDNLAMNEYGSSFWELVVAWPLMFISAIFIVLPRANDALEQKALVGKFATLVSLIVFVFFIVSISTRELVYTTKVDVAWVNTVHTLLSFHNP
jgi:uncharacterized membrane protein YhaH (DUF805 family)